MIVNKSHGGFSIKAIPDGTKTAAISTTPLGIATFSFSAEALEKAIIAVISNIDAPIMISTDPNTAPTTSLGVYVADAKTGGASIVIEGNTDINNLRMVSQNGTTANPTIVLHKLERL